MRNLAGRLKRLERAMNPYGAEELVTALALETGGDDLMLVGQEWFPCPDVRRVLRQVNPCVKVYLGFTAEEL
jgi:hypothetical protein